MELVKNIFFNTDKIVEGSTVRISYVGQLFQSGSKDVYLHYGYDEKWNNLGEIKAEKTQLGYQTEITIPYGYKTLNFCYRNEVNNWDNNYGNDYTFNIEPCVQSIEKFKVVEAIKTNSEKLGIVNEDKTVTVAAPIESKENIEKSTVIKSNVDVSKYSTDSSVNYGTANNYNIHDISTTAVDSISENAKTVKKASVTEDIEINGPTVTIDTTKSNVNKSPINAIKNTTSSDTYGISKNDENSISTSTVKNNVTTGTVINAKDNLNTNIVNTFGYNTKTTTTSTYKNNTNFANTLGNSVNSTPTSTYTSINNTNNFKNGINSKPTATYTTNVNTNNTNTSKNNVNSTSTATYTTNVNINNTNTSKYSANSTPTSTYTRNVNTNNTDTSKDNVNYTPTSTYTRNTNNNNTSKDNVNYTPTSSYTHDVNSNKITTSKNNVNSISTSAVKHTISTEVVSDTKNNLTANTINNTNSTKKNSLTTDLEIYKGLSTSRLWTKKIKLTIYKIIKFISGSYKKKFNE